jgi:hypothetical protein
MQRSGSPTPFTAAWLVLVVAFCVAVGMWGAQISTALGPTVGPVAVVPVPLASSAPNIVTDYTSDGTATRSSLCDELAPHAPTVTVETPTGLILSTMQCSK